MQNTIQHNEKTMLKIKYNAACIPVAIFRFPLYKFYYALYYTYFITYPDVIGDIIRNTRSFVNYYSSFNCHKYLES